MSRVAIEIAPISSETPTHGIDSVTAQQPLNFHGPEDERRSLGGDPPALGRSDSKWKTAGIIACVTCFIVMNSFLAAVVSCLDTRHCYGFAIGCKPGVMVRITPASFADRGI